MAIRYDKSFSTLYRVEGCAATDTSGYLQLFSLFQYPLSGRRLCSPGRRSHRSHEPAVSVPSIGSKAVQRRVLGHLRRGQ
ncbi:protein of unknown function [Candidatus Promineifilum breve]|uniref:Uncharacterized protein n=1 Tax=Candidatus Promineifilum breve TaxID=1806508 RepID=A0A160T2G9_9CHLR|nr:protein of unknown function [Candidatus Promineifilum breve]